MHWPYVTYFALRLPSILSHGVCSARNYRAKPVLLRVPDSVRMKQPQRRMRNSMVSVTYSRMHTRARMRGERLHLPCRDNSLRFSLVFFLAVFFFLVRTAWRHSRHSQPLRNTRGDPKEQYLTAQTPQGDPHSLVQVNKQAHKPAQFVGCASQVSLIRTSSRAPHRCQCRKCSHTSWVRFIRVCSLLVSKSGTVGRRHCEWCSRGTAAAGGAAV
jgi:hypothetical protein